MAERTSDLTDALTRLAEAAGIEPAYWDIYGTRHEASPEALTALLDALGLAAGDDAACTASLARLRADEWARPVPAATVLRRGKPFTVSVSVPPEMAAAALPWRLLLEDGSRRQGLIDAPEVVEQADDLGRVRVTMHLPDDLPDGYHTLEIGPAGTASTPSDPERCGGVVITPAACWLPDMLVDGGRGWGIGAQVYALRSHGDWGMGDFGSLSLLAAQAGRLGADVVGVNPLHALFPTKPRDASPYSPSSRLFLNPLYITIEDVPEYPRCAAARTMVEDPAFQRRLRKARSEDYVDYPAVAALKRPVLEELFRAFESGGAPSRRNAFDAFVADGGARLHLFAVFQVLQDAHAPAPWPQWPEHYRHCDSPAINAFAAENARAVRFHLWLQFEADCQLAAASEALSKSGGRIGLYRDLAVGANPDGADAWIDPEAYATKARFGAPPDDLGPLGQDWGLPPLHPHGLRHAGYGPFIDMVRANMRHAGALRIDHAMSLMHLFWIPPGMTAVDGVYVGYPMDDLMGILALESHRNHCAVIGEDLGTVPAGFRERMAEENILSYRVFYFERYDSGLFHRPDVYPRLALACATSHDMATIPGNWRGWDLELRHRLNLTRADTTLDGDMAARADERAKLVAALQDQKLLPPEFPTTLELEDPDVARLVEAVHTFLARTPSALMVVNIDDLAREITQVNVPGTVDQYPNWRRRLHVPVETLMTAPDVTEGLAAIQAERG